MWKRLLFITVILLLLNLSPHVMVSLPKNNEKFFVITTRDSVLRVPQKIFPSSKIINNIKSSSDNMDVPFYINRNKEDMCHVFNFLSGQRYDEEKTNVIWDILWRDFQIDINCDKGNHEIKTKLIKMDKKKEDAILEMWNDFKKNSIFCTMVQYDPRTNPTHAFKLYNKNILEALDEGVKMRISGQYDLLVQPVDSMSKIRDRYKDVSDTYCIDIITEINKLILSNYPFFADRGIGSGNHKAGNLMYGVKYCDIQKLNKSVRDLETTKDHEPATRVTFYLI